MSAPRPIPRWAGRAVFGNRRYDEKPVLITVDGGTVQTAVARAVREARRRPPKRVRIDRVSVTLTRVLVPRVAPARVDDLPTERTVPHGDR